MAKGLITKEEDLEPDVSLFSGYIYAFRELGSCRVNGMGVGPIPFTSIMEYARLYNVEDAEEFLYLMRVMDDTLLDLERDKVRRSSNNGGDKTGKKDRSTS